MAQEPVQRMVSEQVQQASSGADLAGRHRRAGGSYKVRERERGPLGDS